MERTVHPKPDAHAKFLMRHRPYRRCLLHRLLVVKLVASCCFVRLSTAFLQPESNIRSTRKIVTTLLNAHDDSLHAESPFTKLAAQTIKCLIDSTRKRDALSSSGNNSPKGITNWIDDASAAELQACLGAIGLSKDDRAWIRWMKMVPAPMTVELSGDMRMAAASVFGTSSSFDQDEGLGVSKAELLSRIGCRMYILPSGATLSPLETPSGGVAYGKLLFGGVRRHRLLGSSSSTKPPRKVGEKLELSLDSSWMQYGGPLRVYSAVDMGPCALVELSVLPPQTEMPDSIDMFTNSFGWDPHGMFVWNNSTGTQQETGSDKNDTPFSSSPSELLISGGKERDDFFVSTLSTKVGGMQPAINDIVRRVLSGRTFDSSVEFGRKGASCGMLETKELQALGLSPVRGLLLYGPPGCGKSSIAREIAYALRSRPVKIINAPELLDRWVGSSEALVRRMFEDAEDELRACNGDASKSGLHVIVLDEIDSVFRKRTTAQDSGEATRSSVVNQILSKLDGVNAIPNVLLIGLTNRRELLDDALLRPGRLEVQIEIPKPDKQGRREILKIHFGPLRQSGRLSQPLIQAIDGTNEPSGTRAPVTESQTIKQGRKRKAIRRLIQKNSRFQRHIKYDLAADYATGGFSGADIAGLVRCAGSIALARLREQGDGVDGLVMTLEDVKQALAEVKA